MDNDTEPTSNTDEDDFSKLTSDPNLTEEKLRAEMLKYEKAFEEEMNVLAESDSENISEYTSNFFKANAHFAAAQVVWLAMHAESETVRGSMSKYILESAHKVEKENQDPVANIIEGLKKNDGKPQPLNRED